MAGSAIHEAMLDGQAEPHPLHLPVSSNVPSLTLRIPAVCPGRVFLLALPPGLLVSTFVTASASPIAVSAPSSSLPAAAEPPLSSPELASPASSSLLLSPSLPRARSLPLSPPFLRFSCFFFLAHACVDLKCASNSSSMVSLCGGAGKAGVGH